MSDEFVVLDSGLALQTPWFTIRKDRVRFPDSSTGDYFVMERTPFAAVVVIDRDRRICLVSIFRHPIRARRWEIPQGSGVPSAPLVDVAEHEVRQEAGVVASGLSRLGTMHEAYGYSDGRCDIFTAHHASSVPAQPESSEGTTATRWVSTDDFWSLVTAGEITDAVSVAAVALATRKGAFA
jgi:ADP-ribose pyrophosphatase